MLRFLIALLFSLSLLVAGTALAAEPYPKHIFGPAVWKRHVVRKHMPRSMDSALRLARQLRHQGKRRPVKIGAESPFAAWIGGGVDLAAAGQARPQEALRFFGAILDRSRVSLDPVALKRVTSAFNTWAQRATKEAGPSFVALTRLSKALLRAPHLRGQLSEQTREALRNALAAVGASPQGQDLSSSAGKDTKNPESNWTWMQMMAALNHRLRQPMKSHLTKVRDRKAAAIFRDAQPGDLALEPRIADRSARQAVQAILSDSSGQPTHRLLPHLESKVSALRAAGETKVADGLTAALTAMRAKADEQVVGSQEMREILLANRLAKGILTRATRASAGSVLPRTLPPFPRTRSHELIELLARARSRGNRARQLAFLERRAAILVSSEEPTAKSQGKMLREYLNKYKTSWVEKWLSDRLHRFDGTPSPVSWDLTSHFSHDQTASPEQVKQVEKRLAQAWRILRSTIHPQLLATLPPVKVQLVERKKLGLAIGAYDKGVIRIYEGSEVSTILHEFGHHLEEHAPISILARTLALRSIRASGESDCKWGYSRFKGEFVDEYMSRKYLDSATEMLSVSMGKLADPAELRQMVMEDGDMAFHIIDLLQNPR